MPQPSTRASCEGIEKAKQALKGKGLSQDGLADKLTNDPNIEIKSISTSTVNAFFNRKPIKDENFNAICKFLGFNRNEIADTLQESKQVTQQSAPQNDSPNDTTDIDVLVQTARDNIRGYIKKTYGTMRVLDMTQPIGLDDIYIKVNILEKPPKSEWLSTEELLKNVINYKNVDRFGLGKVRSERVPGKTAVEKYSKLMILGKPGAGKTTFLKHIALQCISGIFEKNRIPLFVTVKSFAKKNNSPDLFKYLTQQLLPEFIDSQVIEQLLKQGKLFILLDGLDEVQDPDKQILEHLEEFTNKYYQNKFVITCRIAAREYIFEQFTDVEIADFDSEQIKTFASKWFTAKNNTSKVKEFISELEKNEPIRELATSPLLLTLLCLVFEQTSELSQSRAKLYEEGINILLEKWDKNRNVARDQRPYEELSPKQRKDLLTQIAYPTFEDGKYFFEQEDVEEYIKKSLIIKDNINTKEILQSISAQHGLIIERAHDIYSFSHLTFHEYFTVLKIKQTGDDGLRDLCTHITETRWREVVLLTVEMLKSADLLLQSMKQEIDKLLKNDNKLQQFLAWVEEKSNSVKAPYKKAAVRAYYFDFALALDGNPDGNLTLASALDRNLARYEDLTLDRNLDRNLALDTTLARYLFRYLDRDRDLTLNLDLALDRDLFRDLDLALDRDLDRDLDLALDRDLDRDLDLALDQYLKGEDQLKRELLLLKTELPNSEEDDIFKQWWEENGANWTQELRDTMIKHRNIGHNWQFTDSQKELLDKYYGTNKLLVECLNSCHDVGCGRGQQIEDTLLLPINKAVSILE